MHSIQKTCGNVVQTVRTAVGTTCDSLSTFRGITQYTHSLRRGKDLFFQSFTRYSYTNLSTVIHTPPPLIYERFYPLSTLPITTTKKNKRKE